jgi:hypothetical protein
MYIAFFGLFSLAQQKWDDPSSEKFITPDRDYGRRKESDYSHVAKTVCYESGPLTMVIEAKDCKGTVIFLTGVRIPELSRGPRPRG